ncbi:MAG: hypothetical protein ACRC0X_02145 [Brevinema sp.]
MIELLYEVYEIQESLLETHHLIETKSEAIDFRECYHQQLDNFLGLGMSFYETLVYVCDGNTKINFLLFGALLKKYIKYQKAIEEHNKNVQKLYKG